MGRAKFKLAATAIITFQGKVLMGKKKETRRKVIPGQWHFAGGFVDEGESPEEAVIREVEEETGLNGEIFQLLDVNHSKEIDVGPDDTVRIVFHVGADSKDAEARDDLEEVKWVDPEELEEEIGEMESQYLEASERIPNFLEKLEKMPAF